MEFAVAVIFVHIDVESFLIYNPGDVVGCSRRIKSMRGNNWELMSTICIVPICNGGNNVDNQNKTK